jgi:hypothetical protein
MFKTPYKMRINKSKLLTKGLLFTVANMLWATNAFANEVSEISTPIYTISQGAFKSEFDIDKRKNMTSFDKLTAIPDQLSNKATSKTREQMTNTAKGFVNKSAKNLLVQNSSYDYYADFSIYGATSFLADDLDGDGFYQTFSVIFDADIYSYTASPWGEVYALLYLSKNGGPWVHYFTTDYFIIEGESDTDEYEVMTTFLSGYSADYYDVLIDLYQVGYNDIVASYSSDDDNALYALSLESADHDEPYIEVVQVHGGGSFSIMSLLIVLIIAACKPHIHRK